MAERKFMFMAADGHSEEAAAADHTVLSGLVIGSGSYSAGKITGVTAGSAAGDVVMGLPTTPSAADAAVSKAYVDNPLSGLKWKSPVGVLRVKSDDDQNGVDPTAGSVGEAWLVNNWATETDGDIVEWSGSAWVTILANSGGEPPDGTRIMVTGTGAAGSFVGE